MQVVPQRLPRVRIAAQPRGGKQVLPAPLRPACGYLRASANGSETPGRAAPLLLEPVAQPREVGAQRCLECRRKRRDTVLAALGLPDNEFAALERQVLHPQAQALRQPQSAAVKKARQEPRSRPAAERAVRAPPARSRTTGRRLGWEARVTPSSHGSLTQHMSVEKQQCLQRLVLRRRADLAVHCQMRQELPRRPPHRVRADGVVREGDKPPQPVKVDMLRPSDKWRVRIFSRATASRPAGGVAGRRVRFGMERHQYRAGIGGGGSRCKRRRVCRILRDRETARASEAL